MRAAICLAALLPLAAVAQTAPEPTPEQEAEFEACMARVDDTAIDAFIEEMVERHAETTEAIDAACTAGDRDEAARLYAPLWDEYTAHPEVQKMNACIARMDAALGVSAEQPHVCDME